MPPISSSGRVIMRSRGSLTPAVTVRVAEGAERCVGRWRTRGCRDIALTAREASYCGTPT